MAAESALTKAEADLRLQKATRIPDPTFLVQFEREPPDQPNTIGLGVSFPLPLWNQNRGAIQSAVAARDQAALEVAKIRGQIAVEIATQQLAYTDSSERWDRYEKQIRPDSERVLQAVTFAYSRGGAALLDLLSAERNDNDIRLATAQAMADSASAAADLAAARNAMAEMGPDAGPGNPTDVK